MDVRHFRDRRRKEVRQTVNLNLHHVTKLKECLISCLLRLLVPKLQYSLLAILGGRYYCEGNVARRYAVVKACLVILLTHQFTFSHTKTLRRKETSLSVTMKRWLC
jgi:hypothetical protein